MEMGERQAIYQVSTLQALARGNYYGSTIITEVPIWKRC